MQQLTTLNGRRIGKNNSSQSWRIMHGIMALVIFMIFSASAMGISVSITSPTDNQNVTTGSNLPIQVSISGGTAKQVTYWYDNYVWLANVTASPWSYTWNSVPAGTHSITARATATDNSVSSDVTITINVGASTKSISITSPTDNQTITAGSDLALTVNVTGSSISQVTYWYDNYTWLANVTSSPWSTTWNSVPSGSHVIKARVTYSDNSILDATDVSFTASSNVAVTGVNIVPTSISLATGATSQLSATVSPSNATNQSVTWTSSNTSVATVSSSGLVTGVAAGTANVTVITADGGKTDVCSVTVTTATLGITITSPTNNQSVTTGSNLPITVNVTGSNITQVTYWYDNYTWLANITSSPWSYTWDNVPSGTHTILARVTNSGGATADATSITINVGTSGGGGNGSSVYNRIKRLGTNFWYLYSTDPQQASEIDANHADWTGALVFNKMNPDFTQDNPWSSLFLNDIKIYSVIRFMDWAATNNSPIQNWSDRTQKTDPKQCGQVINPTGTDGNTLSGAGVDQGNGRYTSGVAWEWMVDLSNRNQSDMWVNIPHRTIDPADFSNGDDYLNEYVHKLAILIKTGVDMKNVSVKSMVGGKANLSQLANKSAQDFINAGGIQTGTALNSGLKVYIEYSNEVWMRDQNYWCDKKALAKGWNGWLETKSDGTQVQHGDWAKYAAWAEIRVWKAFQDVYGSAMSSSVVKVAGSTWYDTNQITGLFSDIYNNSTQNPWSIKPDKWKWATYINPNYSAANSDFHSHWTNELTNMASQWSNLKNCLSSVENIGLISYEGGQALQDDASNLRSDLFNSSSDSYNMYSEWITQVYKNYDFVCHYTHYGRFAANSETSGWGAKAYVGQSTSTTYKYNLLKDFVDGNVIKSAYEQDSPIEVTKSSSKDNEVGIYPNPVSQGNMLNIKLKNVQQSNDVLISVISISGQVVEEQKFTGGTSVYELNTQNLKKGIYIINVSSNNQLINSRLVVK